MQTPGRDYRMTANGILLLTQAPSTGDITWSGSYYYRARFAEDDIHLEKVLSQLWRAHKIELVATLGNKV